MAERKEKFYLTTPIYYTNGLPHIGHTYTTVVADVIRRYKRMRGYEVVMTTGTDEHGVNVERAAKKAGIAESEFSRKWPTTWRALWDELGIPADEFVRTTDLQHVRTVQWLFKLCRENGYVDKGHYTGQYCIYDNAFVNEAEARAIPARIAAAPLKPSPKKTIFLNSPHSRSHCSISTRRIRISSSPKRAATKS